MEVNQSTGYCIKAKVVEVKPQVMEVNTSTGYCIKAKVIEVKPQVIEVKPQDMEYKQRLLRTTTVYGGTTTVF